MLYNDAITFHNKIIIKKQLWSKAVLPQNLKTWILNQLLRKIIGFSCGKSNDSYNSLRYNYFTEIVMSYRQLTYEEANKLLEQTLILICRQNKAQRLKRQKSKNSPFLTSSQLPLRSPSKSFMKQAKLEPHQSVTLEHQFDLQKSPFKKVVQTPLKLSIDKESTFMELLDLSQQASFKLIEKQDSCLDLAHRTSIMSSHQELKSLTQLPHQCFQKLALSQQPEQSLYTESSVKELKRDLQIQSKGKICKTQNLNTQTGQIQGYHFLCKNDNDCPFNCYLEYTGIRARKGEKLYRLISQNESHLKGCIESEEEIIFMKLTKFIDSMEDSITKLFSQDAQLKPKDILTKLAQQYGETDYKFIYKGLSSKNYHKAAKKYFDNLIYRVKNPTWAHS